MLGIFLDQETTGLDCNKHRVLEIAFRVIDLANGKELASYSQVIQHPPEIWQTRDPISITINGFTWEEVQKGKSENNVAEDVKASFKACGIQRGKSVFICQNPSFDRPFFAKLIDPYTQEKLFWPYHWLDFASMYWALEIQKCKGVQTAIPDELKLSKDTIAQALRLPGEARPHRAMQGVDHLLLCYRTCVGFPQGV